MRAKGTQKHGPWPVTVALEGGGAHGAFTWGVLERLLDEPRLRIEVLSGASAGAMNAAMVAQGLAIDGPKEAKRQLDAFWRRVADDARMFALPFGGWTELAQRWLSPLVESMNLARSINPLRSILADLLDPSALRRPAAPRIVVSATSVRTGEGRLFTNHDITVDTLLASSCLPTLFATVLIEGEAYWDGGFSSNPPLRPLIEAGTPSDVIIIRTTPLERHAVPSTSRDVTERANELTFGTALRQELRSLAVAQRSLRLLPVLPTTLRRLRDARIHIIGADAEFCSLPAGSRLDTAWSFLTRMRTLGNEAAQSWLADNLGSVGRRSTIATSLFEGPRLADFEASLPAALRRHA
jgi:NTE family protein